MANLQQDLAGPPGSVLREERLSKGISLVDAAEAVNLLKSYVVALEENDYSRFNSPLFARGYIKSYARFLGLDETPLLKDCDRICARLDAAAVKRRPSGRAKAPGQAGVVVALIAALFVWSMSCLIFGGEQRGDISVSILAERYQTPHIAVSPTGLGGSLLSSAVIDEASPSEQAAVVLSEIEFEFSETVWIALHDRDGRVVVQGEQSAGERLRYSVAGPVIINIAYWPAVDITYNDREVVLQGVATSNAVRVQVAEL